MHMGIRQKFILVVATIALLVAGSSYITLNKSHNDLIEQEATRIAEIVTTQVVADRAEYSQNLVGKLKGEGTGAARDSENQEGYIELPAQFVRNVSKRVQEKAGDLYSYSLVSEWNINEDQGLKSDFDRWAWNQLRQQDEQFQHGGHESGEQGFDWMSVSRVDEVDGRRVMRYMKADPASAKSCVSCHNQYEQQADIQAMRTAAGVTPGKSWKLGQLMGAIQVDVPIDEVAAAAAKGRNAMLAGLGGIFLFGFGVLFLLIQKSIIQPVEVSVNEVEGFASKVDAVVGCGRELLLGADEQVSACKSTKSRITETAVVTVGGGDAEEPTEFLVALDQLQQVADNNAKQAEEAAFYCTELDSSFNRLKTRLQRILGRS